jgi:hypothetical protein
MRLNPAQTIMHGLMPACDICGSRVQPIARFFDRQICGDCYHQEPLERREAWNREVEAKWTFEKGDD